MNDDESVCYAIDEVKKIVRIRGAGACCRFLYLEQVTPEQILAGGGHPGDMTYWSNVPHGRRLAYIKARAELIRRGCISSAPTFNTAPE